MDNGIVSCKHICHDASIVRHLRDKSFSEFDILSYKKINVIMAVIFVSPHVRLSPSWILFYENAIDRKLSCHLCYWKSFAEKGCLLKKVVCRFVTTNSISTKMKIHYQPINVKERYLSFDDSESFDICKCYSYSYAQMKVILI